MANAFFDLETTGRGLGKGGLFSKEVGVYSVGFSLGMGEPSSMFGKTSVPLEPGAQFIANLPGNVKGLAAARDTELIMLKQFITTLKDSGVDQLIGYNSHNYDSPLLIKRLKYLGLKEEAAYLEKIKHVDLMKMVKANMDVALSPYKGQISWEFGEGKISKGLNLEAVARGLGIDAGIAHEAKSDVAITQKVYEMAKNPEKFKAHFDATEWARAVDKQTLTRRYIDAGIELTDDALDNIMKMDIGHQDITGRNSVFGQVQAARAKGLLGYESLGQYEDTILGENVEIKGAPWSVSPEPEEVAKATTKTAPTVDETIRNAGEVWNDGVSSAKAAASKAKADVEFLAGKIRANSRAAAIAGGLLGGAYLMTREEEEKPLSDEHLISASALGMSEDEIRREINGSSSILAFNKNIGEKATYGALKAGRKIHKQVEEDLSKMGSFVGSEVPLVDRYLGVKGVADVVLKMRGQQIPVEIKTVDDSKLESLRGPTESHAAQANFYAHALGASESYVMYVSREDPSSRVSFRVAYDPGSLMADVQKFRSAAFMSSPPKGWEEPLNRFFGNKSGTRDQSNRSYFIGYPRTPSYDHHTDNGSRYMR